jgi:acyl carrier protein
MSTEDQLRDFIASELHWRGARRQLTDDRPLIADGIVDSLGLFELVGFVEQHLGVEVADEELLPENFATIATISRFVAAKRAGRLSA